MSAFRESMQVALNIIEYDLETNYEKINAVKEEASSVEHLVEKVECEQPITEFDINIANRTINLQALGFDTRNELKTTVTTEELWNAYQENKCTFSKLAKEDIESKIFHIEGRSNREVPSITVDLYRRRLMALVFGIRHRHYFLHAYLKLSNIDIEDVNCVNDDVSRKFLDDHYNILKIDKKRINFAPAPYLDNPQYEFDSRAREYLHLHLIDNKTYREISELKEEGYDVVEGVFLNGIYRLELFHYGIIKTFIISEEELNDVLEQSKFNDLEKDIIYNLYILNTSRSEICKLFVISNDAKIESIVHRFVTFYTKLKSPIISNEDYSYQTTPKSNDSVLTEIQKEALSLSEGIKNDFNCEGKKHTVEEISEKLKKNPKNVRRILICAHNNMALWKLGIRDLSLGVFSVSELEEILRDKSLPVNKGELEFLRDVKGLWGSSILSMDLLVEKYGITSSAIILCYQKLMLKIKKHLNRECVKIEFDYEEDVAPNLRFFPEYERRILSMYFKDKLSYPMIGNVLNLSTQVIENEMFRLKVYLCEIINNPNKVFYDYDKARETFDSDEFSLSGDKKLLRKVYELYTGDSGQKPLTNDEVIDILGINRGKRFICELVMKIMIEICEYNRGLRKPKELPLQVIQDYYCKNKLKRSSLPHMRAIRNYLGRNTALSLSRKSPLAPTAVYEILKSRGELLVDVDNLENNEVMNLIHIDELCSVTKKVLKVKCGISN